MNKQNVVYLYNGIWFNHKKEWSSITCCNGNEPENITQGKISQSQEAHTSCDSIKMKVLVTQFSSVQSLSRVWLCSPMDCSTPGFPVHHHLPESTQTQVHCVSDAIQPSHPLSSPSRSVMSNSLCQAPLSMGFTKQKYWSGLPFPSPGDLPDPGVKLRCPHIAGRFFPAWANQNRQIHRDRKQVSRGWWEVETLGDCTVSFSEVKCFGKKEVMVAHYFECTKCHLNCTIQNAQFLLHYFNLKNVFLSDLLWSHGN